MMASIALCLVLLAAGVADDPAPSPLPESPPVPVSEPQAAESPPDAPARLASYDELQESYRPTLARAYLREVGMLLSSEAVTPNDFEIAIELVRRAMRWIPDDANAWRVVLDLGRVARNAPGGRDLEREAIAALSRLEPDDEVIRLLRLSEAVNSAETAEERLDGYDKLLSPQVRQQLGPRIASRLAFERALLLSRMGDLDGFARSLADAVATDPAFPAATEMAAGFFASRMDDLAGVAELLVAAIVANPAQLSIYLDLGALLMSQGAYASAERIYRMADLIAAYRDPRTICDVATDLALAQWGNGDPRGALHTLRLRIKRIDEDIQRVIQRISPEMSISELRSKKAVVPPLIATLMAVLAQETSDPNADSDRERMEAAFKGALDDLEKESASGTRVAALRLEHLWALLLLGGNLEVVKDLLARANAASPLSEEAQQRFDGWIAFRSGELETAIERLRPRAVEDNMARLGLGMALVAHGETRDGARELLAVARAERGTALGLFAAARLAEIVNAVPESGPGAAALEAAVAALPPGFDRFMQNARDALSWTVTPEATTYAALDPIRFRVTLVNRSNLTLAIDPLGPIDARAAFAVTISMIGFDTIQLPTAVIPIDRRIELAPQERMSFTVDLSVLPFGAVIALHSLRGMSLELRCVSNFLPMEPRVTPGFLGAEGRSTMVRVDGVRMDDAWKERTWGELDRTGLVPDPRDFVMMAASLTMQENVRDRPLMLRLQTEWAKLAKAFEAYPPVVQAWLLMVLSNTTLADGAFLDVARASGDPLVLGAFLLRRARDPADVAFDVARRMSDPFLHLLADSVQAAIARRLDEMQRAFGIGGGPGALGSGGSGGGGAGQGP